MKLIRIINNLALAVLCMTIFGFCLHSGLGKEADRMDAVRVSNCQNYGATINKYYGDDLCQGIQESMNDI